MYKKIMFISKTAVKYSYILFGTGLEFHYFPLKKTFYFYDSVINHTRIKNNVELDFDGFEKFCKKQYLDLIFVSRMN